MRLEPSTLFYKGEGSKVGGRGGSNFPKGKIEDGSWKRWKKNEGKRGTT